MAELSDSDARSSSSSDSDTLERVVHIDIANQRYKPITASSFMFTNPAKAQGMLDEKLNKQRLTEHDVYSTADNAAPGSTIFSKKKQKKRHRKKPHHSDASSDSSSSSWTSAGTSSGSSESSTSSSSDSE
jgi:hypothetical protein